MSDSPTNKPDPIDKSLGDQATGADVSRLAAHRLKSLGDQSTSGDALSSISDISDLSGDLTNAMSIADIGERYEIQETIGKGGMGVVLRALDTRLKRPVAIKRVLGEMARSKRALSRFLTEAQAIASLNHFNIVQIYDYGHDAEGPFIIMELVEGESLQQKLKAGPLDFDEAIEMACQLCDALAVAHEHGIIHRDIKPANILLTGRGEPKLTDFGLARHETADHGQTKAGVVLGTVDFMPPEQRRDATATDARSDLWSLAATIYQMITGKSPKIIKFRNVPQALQDVLEKALEDAPQDRYQTAREFQVVLQSSLAATAQPAPEVAVDLGAGECDQCHTRNESSRKFCRECAAPLRVSCLACELEIPIWEKVCPECGGKQAELLAAHQNKLSEIIQNSLTLSQKHEYEKALAQLRIVTEDKHATKKTYRKAAKQSEVVIARRDEQYELRDQQLRFAKQFHLEENYEAVIRELEKIPAPLRRGNEISELLSNASSQRSDTSITLPPATTPPTPPATRTLVDLEAAKDSLPLGKSHFDLQLARRKKTPPNENLPEDEFGPISVQTALSLTAWFPLGVVSYAAMGGFGEHAAPFLFWLVWAPVCLAWAFVFYQFFLDAILILLLPSFLVEHHDAQGNLSFKSIFQSNGFWLLFFGYLLPGPVGLISGIVNLCRGRKKHGIAQLIFTVLICSFFGQAVHSTRKPADPVVTSRPTLSNRRIPISSDLVGTWDITYPDGGGDDSIQLHSNGTCSSEKKEPGKWSYSYGEIKMTWYLNTVMERTETGRITFHRNNFTFFRTESNDTVIEWTRR